MKDAVFPDVTPCGSCKDRRFGGKYRFAACFRSKLLLTLFLALRLLSSDEVPPKRRLFQEPYGVTSQRAAFFMVLLSYL
jgi:hypothetical protein